MHRNFLETRGSESIARILLLRAAPLDMPEGTTTIAHHGWYYHLLLLHFLLLLRFFLSSVACYCLSKDDVTVAVDVVYCRYAIIYQLYMLED